MIYRFFRPFLFKFYPETAHHLTLQLMRIGGIQPFNAVLRMIFSASPKPVEAFGLTFKNPVGLAAGYDKNGVAMRGMSALGFGHIEVGTVTPRPQPGNPKPRVFRLVEDGGLINRLGFPGRGMEDVACNLRYRSEAILGVNLGKNKDTPLEEAAGDYLALMHTFAPLADYLAINISSPNTVGLRRLQGREMLQGLLGRLRDERENLPKNPPLLIKLAPDLDDAELDDALDVILSTGMDGVIATNTTLRREGLRSSRQAENGGLSGKPLTELSDAILSKVVKRVDGRIPVVGVGGIMSPDDALRKLDLGATLVQVYTGMIYAGPGLPKAMIQKI